MSKLAGKKVTYISQYYYVKSRGKSMPKFLDSISQLLMSLLEKKNHNFALTPTGSQQV